MALVTAQDLCLRTQATLDQIDGGLYKNLDRTTKELELLLQDVRLYPTRYVNVSLFGKKNKPYVAPVNDSVTKVKN